MTLCKPSLSPVLVDHLVTATGSADISAETAQAAQSGPVRQSSAINFNATMQAWDTAARPISAKPVRKVAAAIPNADLALPHALKVVKTQALPQQTGGVVQAVFGSEQHTQDLRPRSSDGILQRITVDRGPATGQTFGS